MGLNWTEHFLLGPIRLRQTYVFKDQNRKNGGVKYIKVAFMWSELLRLRLMLCLTLHVFGRCVCLMNSVLDSSGH